MLKDVTDGAVVVDVAVDQGGCIETPVAQEREYTALSDLIGSTSATTV
jgi:alanine dehydrogenase